MNRIVRLLSVGVILGSLIVPILAPMFSALAQWQGTLTVSNNSSTSYTMFPAIVSANISYLITNHYMSSSGNDTVVQISGANIPFMLTSDKITFATALPGNNNVQATFLTEQTPQANPFSIITGYGGYVTTNDTLSLESGNVWRDVFNGYFDATKNGYFENKLAAKVLKGDGSGNITARIYNTENFTTYTAVNAGSLTITAPSIVALNTPGNGTTYVYKDYGANHFNFLDATFSVNVTDQPVNPFGEAGIGFANVVGNTNNFTNSDVWAIFQPRGGGVVWAKLGRGDPETSGNISTSMVLSSGVQYFCNLTRDANSDTVGLGIFSDSSLTTLVASLSLTGFGTTQWRYSYGFANDNSGLVRPFSGTISDFNFPALIQSVSSVPSGLTTVAFNSDGVNFWITANILSSANITTVSVHDSPFPNKFILSNNIMPYSNNITFSVNGTEKLRYQPNTIVYHNQLTDLDGTMNGDITWGTNPSGVSTSISNFVPQNVAIAATQVVSQDIAPPISNPGVTLNPKTAPSPVNPLQPLVDLLAGTYMYDVPPMIIWIVGAFIVSIIVFAIALSMIKHLGLSMIAGSLVWGIATVLTPIPNAFLWVSVFGLIVGIVQENR